MAKSMNLFFISLINGIPLRGGVSHGEIYVDEERKIYMGEPIVRAHSVGENAQWLGVIVEKEAYENGKQTAPPQEKDKYFVEWEVPLKDGKKQRSLVGNWPWLYGDTFQMPNNVEELFGPYQALEERHKCKYENTMEFINANRL